jgi:3,5-epimerase/4-reductase
MTIRGHFYTLLIMKVLLLGSNGYLGQNFLGLYPDAACPQVDIADPRQVAEALDYEKPDVVINCSGKTGRPNVDWCETHKEETLRSNVTGPLILLDELQKRGIYWVHLSSGCIYSGDNNGKGFTEDDAPNFYGSFYSRTKLWSDQILKDFPVLVLRLRMPFDGTKEPRSLISKLSKYTRVLDEQNSLTCIPDLMTATKGLIEKRKTGIYNMTNPGSMSPYEVMEMYKQIVDPAHSFEKLTLENLVEVVKAGRSNCLLSCTKLAGEGLGMPPVRESMEKSLRELASA